MNAQPISVFRLQLIQEALPEVVSAPIPMVGNTVRMVLNCYNLSATTLAATLEGSVDGQFWENITGDALISLSTWGSEGANFVVTYGMVRVRVAIAGSGSKGWFDVGLAFTDQ